MELWHPKRIIFTNIYTLYFMISIGKVLEKSYLKLKRKIKTYGTKVKLNIYGKINTPNFCGKY